MAQLQGRPLPTRLRLDKGFQPCPVERGDEMYPNGIFEFNITRLLAFVQEHADRFQVEQVDLSEFPDYGNSPHLNEEAVRLADLHSKIIVIDRTLATRALISAMHGSQ